MFLNVILMNFLKNKRLFTDNDIYPHILVIRHFFEGNSMSLLNVIQPSLLLTAGVSCALGYKSMI